MGEEFTAKLLSVSNYINSSIESATFSIECWKYSVYGNMPNDRLLLIEQILPPPSIRQSIEEKREAARTRKYARDPKRIGFMYSLVAYLSGKEITAWRNQGQSYECRLSSQQWDTSAQPRLSVHADNPRLILQRDMEFEGDTTEFGLTRVQHWDGFPALQFNGLKVSESSFTPEFGEKLIQVAKLVKTKPSDDSSSMGH